MKCKQCGKEIDIGTDKIQYTHTSWIGAGRYAGAYEFDEEVPKDSGVFCKIECIKNYLERSLMVFTEIIG